MKKGLFIFLASLYSMSLLAQGVANNVPILSDNPTVSELSRLFAETKQGFHDPFVLIPAIAKRGDRVVPLLRDVLYEDTTADSSLQQQAQLVTDSTGNRHLIAPQQKEELRSCALYAEMTLEVINTNLADSVLAQVAGNFPDVELRGRALKALATIYHQKVMDDNSTPDKSIVGLFVLSADDTTRVNELQVSIGSIAREGVKNWLGQDWGEVIPNGSVVGLANAANSTIAQTKQVTSIATTAVQHSEWWFANAAKLQWNGPKAQFVIH